MTAERKVMQRMLPAVFSKHLPPQPPSSTFLLAVLGY
jgi:hypothetical protein